MKLPNAHVGLNADWNCRAWAINGSNRHNGSSFVIDNEDGTYSVVIRFWSAEKINTDGKRPCEVAGKPTAECWGAPSGNDHVEVVVTGLSEEEAATVLERAGGKPTTQTWAWLPIVETVLGNPLTDLRERVPDAAPYVTALEDAALHLLRAACYVEARKMGLTHESAVAEASKVNVRLRRALGYNGKFPHVEF